MALKNAAGKFEAETTAKLGAVRTALQDAEAELARIEAAAPAAALRVHTGEPEDGDSDLLACLPELRASVEHLRLALSAAEAAEHDRIAAAKVEAERARERALLVHLSTLQKEALKLEVHAANLTSSLNRIDQLARAAEATLPASVRANGVWQSAMDPYRLRIRCGIQLMKAARDLGVAPCIEARSTGGAEDRRTGAVMSFSQFIKDVSDFARSGLKHIRTNAPSAVSPVAAGDAGSAIDGSPEPATLSPLLDNPVSSPEAPLNVVKLGEVA